MTTATYQMEYGDGGEWSVARHVRLSDLSGNVIDLADILAAATDNGDNIKIDLSKFKAANGDSMSGSLVINGMSDDPNALTASDFVFQDGVDWASHIPTNFPPEWG